MSSFPFKKEMLRTAAELSYEKLTGIACLFKPADMQLPHFLTLVQERLATGREFSRSGSTSICFFSVQSNVLPNSDATRGYRSR